MQKSPMISSAHSPLSSGSLSYWSMRKKNQINIRTSEKLHFAHCCACWGVTAGAAQDPHSWKKVSHLARDIRSAQSHTYSTAQHTYGHHTVNIMQSYIYNQPLSTLSSRRTVNSIQPYQVSTLTQVPAPLRPQILLISISCRFHFPRQRQREIKRRWVRGGTNNLTVGLPLTITSNPAALTKEKILHMNSYTLRFMSRMQAAVHIHTPTAHPHHGNENIGYLLLVFSNHLGVLNLQNTLLY